jgi:hypothetical protein
MTYHFSSQMVNPTALKTTQSTHKQMYTERFNTLPMNLSSTPAYASSQPPTSQVVVRSVSQKTDPHLGSNEYYSSGIPGVMILRRYNNIFIPQISPN